MAAELHVSERTVENRRREVFRKTETTSVAELVRLSIEAGWEDAGDGGDTNVVETAAI
jgi:DNA-binding NarL/FixJ family response regulator